MQRLGLFEAKNRLSELVDRAAQGEEIGITRRGKLAALIVPPRPSISLKEVFHQVEGIRKRARLPAGVTVSELIKEGRV